MPEAPSPFSVIILAAGASTRMGGDVRKQFLEIGGQRLLDRGVDFFLGRAAQVIVTVPDLDHMGNPIAGALYVRGGQTRTESVMKALEHVNHDRVLVHDAARPFVTDSVLSDVLSGLDSFHCAYPVMPVVNSLVVDTGGKLKRSPRRSRFREVQTPQGFRTKTLRRALAEYGDAHSHLPELIRRLGKKVKHTEGSPWLFKVTYGPSVQMAEYYIAHVHSAPATGEASAPTP
jgi:2-C-methyl-D-erythritol 4-phosphate cytidylyltransferase